MRTLVEDDSKPSTGFLSGFDYSALCPENAAEQQRWPEAHTSLFICGSMLFNVALGSLTLSPKQRAVGAQQSNHQVGAATELHAPREQQCS